jgi:uncharacterized membrane protein YphA (DoxX/SURF4 family)
MAFGAAEGLLDSAARADHHLAVSELARPYFKSRRRNTAARNECAQERRGAMNRAAQVTYFLLRVVAGWLFLQSGSVILFGWFGGMPGPPGSAPPLMSQVGIGGVLEFFGGLAIMLGLLTRPVAFILSGEMAVRAVSRAPWRVAAAKPGLARRAVLFHLPAHGRAGRRRLEPRRAATTQTSASQERGTGGQMTA